MNAGHIERSIRRFASKITNEKAQWWECWLMHVPPSLRNYRNGYARYGDRSVFDELYAHRIVAAAVHGPIPPGMEVDHLCFTRSCVNPFHLRICTARENKQRFHWQELGLKNPSVRPGGGLHRWNKERQADDTCLHGHPWKHHAKTNSQGMRICAECERVAIWRYDAKRGRKYAIRKLAELDQGQVSA